MVTERYAVVRWYLVRCKIKGKKQQSPPGSSLTALPSSDCSSSSSSSSSSISKNSLSRPEICGKTDAESLDLGGRASTRGLGIGESTILAIYFRASSGNEIRESRERDWEERAGVVGGGCEEDNGVIVEFEILW